MEQYIGEALGALLMVLVKVTPLPVLKARIPYKISLKVQSNGK